MKRPFRVVCTGYDLCAHQAAQGYVTKPFHQTMEKARQYALNVATEDVQVLIQKLGLQIEKVSIAATAYDVRVLYKVHSKTFVYSEYCIHEIQEVKKHYYAYRGARILFSRSGRSFTVYDGDYIIGTTNTMNDACTLVDKIDACI